MLAATIFWRGPLRSAIATTRALRRRNLDASNAPDSWTQARDRQPSDCCLSSDPVPGQLDPVSAVHTRQGRARDCVRRHPGPGRNLARNDLWTHRRRLPCYSDRRRKGGDASTPEPLFPLSGGAAVASPRPRGRAHPALAGWPFDQGRQCADPGDAPPIADRDGLPPPSPRDRDPDLRPGGGGLDGFRNRPATAAGRNPSWALAQAPRVLAGYP